MVLNIDFALLTAFFGLTNYYTIEKSAPLRNHKMSALDPALPTADDTALLDIVNNLFLELEHISLQFKNLTDMDSLGKSID